MERDDVRDALGARWAEPHLIDALCALSFDDDWELWSPGEWLRLHDALDGWDTRGPIGTETEGPYVGPPGIAIAGNAAEDMLCLLDRGAGRLEPELVKWDQTLGCFEVVGPLV